MSQEIDSLSEWLTVRQSIDWSVSSSSEKVGQGRDGHWEFLTNFVAKRSEHRAQCMKQALLTVREDAKKKVPLSFPLLAKWQQIVLQKGDETNTENSIERPLTFRKDPAFAKGGRERYGITLETPEMFEQCLVQAQHVSRPYVSVSARAARAYLDVLFFHPFYDGNGRCAELVLDFVLSLENNLLKQAAPLFLFPRAANDREGTLALIQSVELLRYQTV